MLLAFKDSISFRELPSPNDLEVLSAEITTNNLNFVICLTYRPPNCTEQCNTSLLSYLRSFDNPTDLLLIGDLNLPDVDWNIVPIVVIPLSPTPMLKWYLTLI